MHVSGYEPQTSQFMRKWSIKADKGSNVIPGRQQSISNASACNLFSYEKFSFQGNPRWFSILNWCIADVIVIVTVWVAVSERGFAIPSVSEANIWQPTQWDLCCTSLTASLHISVSIHPWLCYKVHQARENSFFPIWINTVPCISMKDVTEIWAPFILHAK